MKRTGLAPVEPAYEAIEMPRNSPAGFITAFFAVVMGFSLIWHIWWLAIFWLPRRHNRGLDSRLEHRA